MRAFARQLFHRRWGATNLPGVPAGFDENDEIMETLAMVAGAGDHLHLLRRVLETIVLANRDKPIRQEDILQALADETRWLLTRLRYRGRELSEQALKDWLEQFPATLRPVAFQVFSAIASSYYIGQDTFHDALGFLIGTAGIPPRARVSFCKWQELGASGPRVAHAMKNQANWRLLPEIDLTADDKGWPTFEGYLPQWFVIADDMVGSGNTLRRLTCGQDAPVRRLLQRFPAAQLRILIVVAFEAPLREAKADLDEFRDRVELVSYRLLGVADRCFTTESNILPDRTHRELLLRFCQDRGGGRIDISPAFRLGYKELATVLVFFDTVPNNSLPMLWHRGSAWEPLFPASD